MTQSYWLGQKEDSSTQPKCTGACKLNEPELTHAGTFYVQQT